MLFGLTSREIELDQLKPWSVISVVWRDAYDAPNGWTDVSTYKGEDQIASSIGFYWKDCQEEYITLSSTLFTSELPNPDTAGNVTHIPIAMIQSIRILVEPNDKKDKLNNPFRQKD